MIAMSSHALLGGILVIGLAAGVTAAATQIAMLRAIRRELDEETAPYGRLRVVQILYQAHRMLVPQSRLRKIHCASLVLFFSSFIGLILLDKLLIHR